MKKWFVGFTVIALMLVTDRLIGLYLEPRLEKTLTYLFDMPVIIKGLRVNPVLGHARASRLIFMNQPIFEEKPHLDAQGVFASINFLALRDKRVKIGKISLNRPFYLIERITTKEGPRNNVNLWFRHIRDLKKKSEARDKKLGALPEKGWEVQIGKIELRDGTFIFYDRSRAPEKRLVFQKLDGYLTNFKWPTEDPAMLDQEVKIRGKFGEQHPAPIKIEGWANFATSQINFDLEGEIRGGKVVDHKALWEGLPLEITGGEFDLKSHMVCARREIKSRNDLTLKSLKVKPGPAATDKIWGNSLKASIKFMQEQETLNLRVPVRGNITDPEFKFDTAFQKAFQRALRKRTQSGIKLFTSGAGKLAEQTQKLAVQTQQIVLETPGKLVGGIEKLASFGKNTDAVHKDALKEES